MNPVLVVSLVPKKKGVKAESSGLFRGFSFELLESLCGVYVISYTELRLNSGTKVEQWKN